MTNGTIMRERAARVVTGPPTPARLRQRRTGLTAFLVLGSPGLALYAFAVLLPLSLGLVYSTQDYNLLSSSGSFVGLQNYREILTDPAFRSAYGFTLAVTAFLIVVANVAGVLLALALNRPTRPFHLLRTVTFVPVILSGVVVAFLWSTILTDTGILNSLLDGLHLGSLRHSWLGTDRGAQVSIMIVSVWPMIGFAATVYLAALQGVPAELLEAAAVDGAGPVRRFFTVTWPLLRPALVVNSTVMLINGAKSYEASLILTGGGPNGATETGALHVLRIGFAENRAGYAAAIAMVLLVTVAVLSAAGLALGRKADR